MPYQNHKLAVAVVHGVGNEKPDFAERFRRKLLAAFKKETRGEIVHPEDVLIIKPVYWAPAVQGLENELMRRIMGGDSSLCYRDLRNFMVSFAGDAIAYQPVRAKQDAYIAIHAIFAKTLQNLAKEAGENAPLCIVGHSLGSVISSNYIYDLQMDSVKNLIHPSVKKEMRDTPFEKGKTLALFYTAGSPIALWSLRYEDFGTPIDMPGNGKWFNVYDNNDVISYPLKNLNEKYRAVVTEDIPMSVGGFLTSWNPLCHVSYFDNGSFVRHVARSLAEVWKHENRGL